MHGSRTRGATGRFRAVALPVGPSGASPAAGQRDATASLPVGVAVAGVASDP